MPTVRDLSKESFAHRVTEAIGMGVLPLELSSPPRTSMEGVANFLGFGMPKGLRNRESQLDEESAEDPRTKREATLFYKSCLNLIMTQTSADEKSAKVFIDAISSRLHDGDEETRCCTFKFFKYFFRLKSLP